MAMTQEQAQIKVCGIMCKLAPRDNELYLPTPEKNGGLEEDLNFLSTIVSYTLLDLEAKIREARAEHGK